MFLFLKKTFFRLNAIQSSYNAKIELYIKLELL